MVRKKKTGPTQKIQFGNDGTPPPAIAHCPVVSPSSPKKRRRDRGKPGELCQLNLDVLFLISAYIHPIDLLSLARTCRSLRELLMNKSSDFVWRTARSHVRGLPDCPPDLTEPEYANLLFCARCHGCGKYTKMVIWTMRRRYCPDCRIARLFNFYSCHEVIRTKDVLAAEYVTVNGETTKWVDKQQMKSFMYEYNHSVDKKQFLLDKQNQLAGIWEHAYQCMDWKSSVESARKHDRLLSQHERESSIFEHLIQHGYEPEIEWAGEDVVQQSNISHFRTSKPLTDKEWARLWPEWRETMDNFRVQRLNETVFTSRRDLLVTKYRGYVQSPTLDAPTFDILPHASDLIRFQPFKDLIEAPEETRVDGDAFESAFAQLPELVNEWQENLEAELAELVKIPPFKDASGRRIKRQAVSNKLRLACAVFDTGHIYAYPDVLSLAMRDQKCQGAYPESTKPLLERLGVKFMKEAPYVIHACGLDPNMATAEDMDHRNARVMCLSCQSQCVMKWRHALWHVYHDHQTSLTKTGPHLQAVGDEHIDAIQAVESYSTTEPFAHWTRCLLCRPSVGDARSRYETTRHLTYCHGIRKDSDFKKGTHYKPLDISNELCYVEKMVDEGGHVTFKKNWF